MCEKKGNTEICGCCEYQGWTNSATWSVAYLTQQERPIYEYLVAIRKQRKVTGKDIKFCWDTMKHEPKDKWTKGVINWQEIADTHYNDEKY